MILDYDRLKQGYVAYLSPQQLTELRTFIQANENQLEKLYFEKHFKYKIDSDDVERSTYECFCTITFNEFLSQSTSTNHTSVINEKEEVKKMYQQPADTSTDKAVEIILNQVSQAIKKIESQYNVRLVAEGNKITIHDNDTGAEKHFI